MLGTYTYRLNGTVVHPEGDWTFSYERNAGQIFFRKHLRGELTFRGADYDLIMGMADCDVLEFKIYCGASEYWEGQFKMPYDFDIDTDSCFLKGEPEVVDEYSCIMNYYETEYGVNPAIAFVQPVVNNCAGGALHTMPNAYLLGDSTGGSVNHISSILGTGRMNCGLDQYSSFMWRDNFPNGDNYAAAYGVNNYITGAGNRLEYLYLLQNYLVRTTMGGTGCDGSGGIRITFKEIEELLRHWFNAYWYIDQNGDFRIEHIRFFDPAFPNSDFTVDRDLRTLISSNGRHFAYRRNKYSYDTGELYDQERWTMMHYEGIEGGLAHGSDFDAPPVYYGSAENVKSDCVPGEFKEAEYGTPRFWSDVTWAWGIATNPPNAAGTGQPDTVRCNGWLVLDVDTAAANHINCEVGIWSGANGMNNHLSIANLQNHYHQYDRIFLSGTMGYGGATVVTTFQTAKKIMVQEPIEFPLCCADDFDSLNLIRTELGDGRLKSATQKKRSIEVELLY